MRSRSSLTSLRGKHCASAISSLADPRHFRIGSTGLRGRNSPRCKKAETKALDQTGIAVGSDDNPRGHAQAQPPAQQSGPIIGQTHYRHSQRDRRVKKGGAQIASTKIVKKDYITLQGNAYVSIIGQSSILSIQHAMDLYHAANDRYPKDYDEFMTEIIKANNIALPHFPLIRSTATTKTSTSLSSSNTT